MAEGDIRKGDDVCCGEHDGVADVDGLRRGMRRRRVLLTWPLIVYMQRLLCW